MVHFASMVVIVLIHTRFSHGTDDSSIDCEYNADFSSCYWVHTTTRSFNDARTSCQMESGGHLAVISSQAENSWITTKLDADSPGWAHAWIGYDDISSEGQFVWVEQMDHDGSLYENWNSGEPNNSGDEDCTEMYSTGKWNDRSCSNTFIAICENNIERPTLTCPSDAIVNTDIGAATASVDYSGTISANGNTGDVPTISPDPTGTFPASLGIGETPFTFTATDSLGNADTCTFTITVEDTEPPTLTCPSDAIVDTDMGTATASVDYSGTISASDNSGAVPAISPDPTESFPASIGIGENPFTFTATDSSENTDTCAFTITAEDTEPPILTCPSDAIVDTDMGAAGVTASVDYSAAISAVDNSGAAPAISPDPTATFPASLGRGPNILTFTATDSSGNTDTCTFTITVKAFRSRLMVHREKGPSKHHVIRIRHTQSAIRCGALCMMDPLCVSMHFGKDTCQMYGISGGDGEEDITTDTNMAYYENTQP